MNGDALVARGAQLARYSTGSHALTKSNVTG